MINFELELCHKASIIYFIDSPPFRFCTSKKPFIHICIYSLFPELKIPNWNFPTNPNTNSICLLDNYITLYNSYPAPFITQVIEFNEGDL